MQHARERGGARCTCPGAGAAVQGGCRGAGRKGRAGAGGWRVGWVGGWVGVPCSAGVCQASQGRGWVAGAGAPHFFCGGGRGGEAGERAACGLLPSCPHAHSLPPAAHSSPPHLLLLLGGALHRRRRRRRRQVLAPLLLLPLCALLALCGRRRTWGWGGGDGALLPGAGAGQAAPPIGGERAPHRAAHTARCRPPSAPRSARSTCPRPSFFLGGGGGGRGLGGFTSPRRCRARPRAQPPHHRGPQGRQAGGAHLNSALWVAPASSPAVTPRALKSASVSFTKMLKAAQWVC